MEYLEPMIGIYIGDSVLAGIKAADRVVVLRYYGSPPEYAELVGKIIEGDDVTTYFKV